MTPQIKQRIDQIQRGEVPEGYERTTAGIIPSTWYTFSLGDLYTERKESGIPSLPILTVSIHSGVSDGALDDDEIGKKVKRIEDKTQYRTARSGDVVFNMMRAWQGAIGVVRQDGLVSPAYIVATPKETVYPQFMDYCLKTPQMINRLHRKSYGVTDFRLRLYWDSFAKVDCVLPPFAEQKKIAEILSAQDKLIALKEKLIEEKKRQKKALIKQILNDKAIKSKFSAHWETVELKDVFDYIQPTKYLVESTDYSDDYETPVLTAGKSFILGYTNEIHGIFDQVPAVIFDDFTTDSKYVDFPFKAKSSAMKILMVKDGFDIQFAFELLQNIDYNVGGHERHWISVFSQMTVDVPPYEVQQKIGQIIQCVNNEIDLLQKDLYQEKQKKKALMQLLLTGIVRA